MVVMPLRLGYNTVQYKGNDMNGKQTRTIDRIITKKVDEWLETIDNEELRESCKRDVIVTGGCIASMLLGEQVNDYDVYFKSYSTTVNVADYYLKKFQKNRSAQVRQGGIKYDMNLEELLDTQNRKRVRIVVKSAGIAGEEQKQDYEYFETEGAQGDAEDYVNEAFMNAEGEATTEDKPDYAPVFLSSNAITLKGGVQLILRFHGDHEAIHENFDFIHCTNYWTRKEKVVTNPEALLALMSRTLIYRGSLYPICSIFRSKKFIKRGWRINAGQYLKMALQIGELDLTSPIILEEQLTGVDVAYFQEVINMVRDKNDPEAPVDGTYLLTIVDKMFG
mgnify:CR=1 FL=1|tara:strand:+ start:15777 stop:16781 length:1005 start_codon:yes stop_codon:yes gene_type:complete